MSDPIKTAVDLMIEVCRTDGLDLKFSYAEVTEPAVVNFVADEITTGATITIRCAFNDVSDTVVSPYVISLVITAPGYRLLYKGDSTVDGTLYEAASEAATKICNWLSDYRFPPTEVTES